MDPAKISVQAVAVLSRITLKTGWDIGPLSADALLAPKLCIGASLVDTSNGEWGLFAVQTARGQTEALLRVEHKLNAELAIGSTVTRVNQDQLNQIAIAAGLWFQILERLVPSLMLPEEAVNSLSSRFVSDTDLFLSLEKLSYTEVPDDSVDQASILTFVLKHVHVLRRTQEEHRKQLREGAEGHPSNILYKEEMTQLTSHLYLGQLVWDANRYRQARAKATLEVDKVTDQRAEAERRHIASVQAARDRMQQSDIWALLN